MKRVKKIVSVFIIIVCVIASCKKPDEYPDTPTLEFRSLTFSKDTSGFATFTISARFTDGDGDVGYDAADYPDASGPYYSNFVLTMLRFHNGVWTDTIEWCMETNDTLGIFNMPTRIPNLTPTGKNKSLKGDISKTEDLPACLLDTIKIRAFLYDRALHKSNTIESPAYFIDTTH